MSHERRRTYLTVLDTSFESCSHYGLPADLNATKVRALVLLETGRAPLER